MITINYLKKIVLLVALTILFSCEQEVSETDLIKNIEFSKTELIANGSDVTSIKVFFNEESNIELISLKIETDNGVFLESQDNEIELIPKENLEGEIFAEVNLVSSSVNTDYNLTFEVDKYFYYENLTSINSEPSSISISSSAFSVYNNFDSEITLEAVLSNENYGGVSSGVKVRFTDTFSDGTPVNGSFRSQSLTSNSQSKVSTIYSPGTIDPDQYINLTVEVLDDDENPIGISDIIDVYVNEKQ